MEHGFHCLPRNCNFFSVYQCPVQGLSEYVSAYLGTLTDFCPSPNKCLATFTVRMRSKPFTYALCLDEVGADTVQQYIGREPSGRLFNEIVLDYNGKHAAGLQW